MPTHAIAVVSRMTGLSVDTLRAWERRYRLVTPARDESGVRRYTEQDVARLELARAATTLGHPIRSVARLSDDELHRLVRTAHAREADAGHAEPTVHAAIEALQRYDLDRVERVLHSAALLMPTGEFVTGVLAPMLHRVGALWESGRLSIAQEHLVSHLVRTLVGRLARLREPGVPCSMLFATPPGELHEFGIDLAACIAAMHGQRPCVLGPNLPPGEIVAAARHLRPRTVVVGITMPMPSAGETAGWPRRAHHVATLHDFLHRVASAA